MSDNTNLPIVSFTTDKSTVAEGEQFIWKFSLDRPAPAEGLTLTLPILDNNEPGPGDVNFFADSSNVTNFDFIVENGVSIGFKVTLAAGATEATVVNRTISDGASELNETVTIALAQGVNYSVSPTQNQVPLTITDLPTVSFTTDKTFVQEGEEFSWFFNLDKPVPAGGLTLTLPILDNNEPGPGDVNFFADSSNVTNFDFIVENGVSIGFKVTLAEGATNAKVVNRVNEDGIAESTEIFTTALAQGVNYAVSPTAKQAKTTLIDPSNVEPPFTSTTLPTVSFTTDKSTVAEGEQFIWKFSLDRPAPAEGLTLTLPILDNNEPGPGDVNFFADSSNVTNFDFIVENGVSIGFKVTLAAGATEATVVNRTISDGASELNETVTVALAQGVNYSVSPTQNQVPLTITDLPTVSFTADRTSVQEGEEFSWFFNLDKPVPAGGLTLTLPILDNNEPGPGDVNFFADSSNVTNFDFIVENGVSIGFKVTLAEGATNAKVVNRASEDGIAEFTEIFTTALAQGVNYAVSPTAKQVKTTITDLSIKGDGSISIKNPDFEEPVLADGAFNFSPPTGWNTFDPFGFVPENPILASSNVSALNPTKSVYPGEAPSGQNVASVYLIQAPGVASVGLAQTLDTVVQANTKYTLTVDVGNLVGNSEGGANLNGFPGYRVVLVAGDEIVAVDNNSLQIGEGEFATSTVSFTAAAGESFVSKNLGIRLINALTGEGTEVDFDNVRLNAQAVIASAASDNQILYGSSGTTTLSGGVGNDIIFGNGLSTTLFGRDGNDQLYGASTDDYIGGGAGNDIIFGNGGKDVLLGDAGDDIIFGGLQADIILGGAGNDTIYGNGGSDLIDGNSGNNTIFLGSGDTTIALNRGGFDTVNNFQLGSSRFFVGSLLNDLSFADSSIGVRISAGKDLLAVVSNQTASTFSSNAGAIFKG
jgi:Ca2+-binding RTX toxin-like protein